MGRTEQFAEVDLAADGEQGGIVRARITGSDGARLIAEPV